MKSRYEVSSALGKGGVGEVFLADDHQLKRKVAIKRLLAEEGDEATEATESLMREATTLSSLNHPNIVTVHDVGVDEAGAYVIMEYLEGETFEELVSRGAMTWDDFQSVAVQALEGMIAAQHHGLVHRDIKPGNLMVIWRPSGSFAVKILDFGLAKFSPKPSKQTVDQGDAIMGSIYFMAPEQFERGELDGRTDLYSLGAVFYFGLTGHYPFDGDSAAGVMAAHLEHRVERLDNLRPDVPMWACEWVHWLMRRHQEERPRDAAHALEVFVRQGEGLPHGGGTTARRLVTPGTASTQTGQVGTQRVGSDSSAQGTIANQTKSHPLPSGAGASPISRGMLFGGLALVLIAATAVILWLSRTGSAEQEDRIAELLEEGSFEETGRVVGDGSDWQLLYPLLAGGYSEKSRGPGARGRAATQALAKLSWEGTDDAVREALAEETGGNTLGNLMRIAVEREISSADEIVLERLEEINSDAKPLLLDGIRQLLMDGSDPLSREQFQAVLADFLREEGSAAAGLHALLQVALDEADNPGNYAPPLLSAAGDEELETAKRSRVWTLLASSGSEDGIAYLDERAKSGDEAQEQLALNALGSARDGRATGFLIERALRKYSELPDSTGTGPLMEQQRVFVVLQAAMNQASKAPSDEARAALERAVAEIDQSSFLDLITSALRNRSEDWALALVDELIRLHPNRRTEWERLKAEIQAKATTAEQTS